MSTRGDPRSVESGGAREQQPSLRGSTQTKSKTGKRLNSEGFFEHYRCCLKCDSRFRVIFE